MVSRLILVLLIPALLFGGFAVSFADNPIYMVEIRSNPPQPFDFTGHKRYGDVNPVLGDEWTETVEVYGLPVQLQFRVMSVSETVQTPAGVFENCVYTRLRIYLWPIIDELVKWYNADGVGRVKVWTEQTGDVLLQDYHIEGGYGYEPAAVGNWWLFDGGNRPAVVAYEQHLGYPCYRVEDPEQTLISWIHYTGVPGPSLPDIYIGMMPQNIPVTVPPGGNFAFTATIGNTTNQPQTSDVWIMLRLPGGMVFGPIQQFNNIPLSPNISIVVAGVTQYVPGFAPQGTYDYIAYCGDYPSTVIDSTSFQFTVTGSALSEQNNEWILTGWFDDNKDISIPAGFSLGQNYPNPFNATTTIEYQLPVASDVSLEIYNLLGRKVETLVESRINAGNHIVSWDASKFSSGIYFYKLTAGHNVITRKMNLLK